MQAHEIEYYLTELGAALENHGIIKPVRMLLIGGAYTHDMRNEFAKMFRPALRVARSAQ